MTTFPISAWAYSALHAAIKPELWSTASDSPPGSGFWLTEWEIHHHRGKRLILGVTEYKSTKETGNKIEDQRFYLKEVEDEE